jgi:hypothetical protein
VRESLAGKQTTVLEHPPYSPDVVPSDFLLFQKIKEISEGRHFNDIEDIRSNTRAALRPFHKISSKIVFIGGLGTGIGA